MFWITVIRNLRSAALEPEPFIATSLNKLHVNSFRAQSVIITLKEANEAEVLLGGIEKLEPRY